MKHIRLHCAALGLALLLAACAPGGDAPEPDADIPQAPSQAGPSQPADRDDAPEEDAPPQSLQDVTGDYLVLQGGYYQSPPAHLESEYLSLGSVVDVGSLVLAWEVSNGRQGPTLLDARNTASGDLLFQLELEGYSYVVESTGELPENLRAVQRDRVVYIATGAPERQEVYTLPETVAAGLWSLSYGGAPYDYARGRDIIAWSADDGVYVAGGDGSDPRLVLPAAHIQGLLDQGPDPQLSSQRAEYAIPEWGDSTYHYAAPVFLNSGRQVIASACAVSVEHPDYEPAMLFVAWADLETGETGHTALQFHPNTGPAAKYGGGSVLYSTYAGDCVLELGLEGADISVIPHSEDFFMEERTWDHETYYRVREREGASELYRYQRGNPEDGQVLLSTAREYLSFWWLGDRYALCEAGSYDPAASDLLLVSLE